MDVMRGVEWVDLTSRQRSIWLELQSFGSESGYQIGGYIRIAGRIDPALFEAAVTCVMNGNESLRLQVDSLEPRQRVVQFARAPVEFVDYSAKPDPEADFIAFAEAAFVKPFPLDGRPLFSVTLARISDDVWFGLLRCHHLIVDGLSIPILVKAIADTYDALASGDSKAVPAGTTYFDFAADDAAYRESSRAARDIDYWRDHLAKLPPRVFEPRSSGEVAVGRATATLLRWPMPREAYGRFLDVCNDLQVRPVSALLGLVGVLVGNLSGSDKAVLGIAVPGRTSASHDKVGMFNGAMPVSVALDPTLNFGPMMAELGRELGRDYRHQRAPIDEICRACHVGRDGRRGVFDVFMSYIPADLTNFDFHMAGAPIEPIILRSPEANPLAIYVSESNRGRPVLVEFAFNPAYLTREGAETLLERFQQLIARFCEEPATAIGAIQLFTDEERRKIRGLRDEKPVVHVVSTFTADPVGGVIAYWSKRLGLGESVTFSEYNQVFQELIDPSSALRAGRARASALLIRIEDWLRFRSDDAPASEAADFVRDVAERFVAALAAAGPLKVPCIVLLCPPSPEWSEDGAFAALQVEVEARIAAGVSALPNVHLITPGEVARLYASSDTWDAESDRLGHIPYTTSGFTALGTALARRINLATRKPVKVIIADCDNTLWGGVVGEDGVRGLKLEPHHLALQARLVEAAKSGVLVGLCSKNIEDDVFAVFDEREDMVLKREHIVVHRVNWEPKSANLRSMALELSLGEDSFVFLDDNPVEIGEVRANCPAVTSVKVDFAAERPFMAEHLWPLDVAAATAEDVKRTQFYRDNARRTDLQREFGNHARFIEELQLNIRIEAPRERDLARLQQLTERTNQFNINGIKRSVEDFAPAEGRVARAVFVSDRFGDYGLVGLFLAHAEGGDLLFDSLLMSCRVLGRGVEHGMFAAAGQFAVEMGLKGVRLTALNLPRNKPVRQFVEKLPGARVAEDGSIEVATSAAEAAAHSFRPSTGRDDSMDVLAEAAEAAPARRAGVPDETWEEMAHLLNRVDDISHAVRQSGITVRNVVTEYVAPRTRLETELAGILAELLGVERVGLNDNFFEIGVNSLLAVQFASRIRSQCGVEFPLRAMFERPNLAQLAELFSDGNEASRSYGALVPLQLSDRGYPLFCLHPANGDAVSFMRLAKALGPSQSVYAFEASGLGPNEPLAGSIEEMAEAYIAEMRKVQPHGPYHFLGWSLGGAIAYEMATKLQREGETIGLLAFMDTAVPFGRDDPRLTFEEVMRVLASDLEQIERGWQLPLRASRRNAQAITIQKVIDTAVRMGVAPQGYSVEDATRKIQVYANCVQLYRQYEPPHSDLPILIFRATKERMGEYHWWAFTDGKVTIKKVRAKHVQLGFEPFTHIIAPHILAAMRGETHRPKPLSEFMRRLTFRIRQSVPMLQEA